MSILCCVAVAVIGLLLSFGVLRGFGGSHHTGAGPTMPRHPTYHCGPVPRSPQGEFGAPGHSGAALTGTDQYRSMPVRLSSHQAIASVSTLAFFGTLRSEPSSKTNW
ncbi:hypothetical protein ACFFX0_21380 [Citricoccus parietis]|uniref:Secreted protein n=1 Tax=Citricoccus parietis TaxID=592307 RepID=A0ABV5G3T5_9MICC